MPKQLKEIRNFNLGTILNISEKDVPDDAATYSLNVNPLSENGILNSIMSDKYVFSSDDSELDIIDPISFNEAGENNQDLFTVTDEIYFNNIDALNKQANTRISFIGTKGIKETLILSNPQPFYEKVLNNSAIYTLELSAIGINDTSIPFLNKTNAITAGTISNVAFTGITNGQGTITVSGTPADGGHFDITSADGKVIRYEVDTGGGTATGDLIGSNVCIQINGVTGNDNIAAQIKAAIEDTDNGHTTRITVSANSNVLTLTDNLSTLDELLEEGDYFSLSSNGSYANQEIIRVSSFTETDVNIERGCFGTGQTSYAANNYTVFANKQTIDGVQVSTKKFTAEIGNWSEYSGNNINGNSAHLKSGASAFGEEKNGLLGLSANYTLDPGSGIVTTAIVFNNKDKTLTFNGETSLVRILSSFNEGDRITFYHDQASQANTGFSTEILKKEIVSSNLVITLKDAPTDLSAYSTGNLFYESNLLKNHTLHHSVSSTTQTVGASVEYKINDWAHRCYTEPLSASNNNIVTNKIGYSVNDTNNVLYVSSGGYWDTSNAHIDLGGTTDKSSRMYPFQDGDSYIKIISEYVPVSAGTALTFGNTLTASSDDNNLFLNTNANQLLSKNDIIKLGNEYMVVSTVENKKITVIRGALESTIIAHDGTSTPIAISKCVNHSISQSVDKSLLKKNTSYNLSFYAQDDNNGGIGALSIQFNGGYITSNGTWVANSTNVKNGYGTDINDIMQEDRWINFADLEKPNDDIAQNSGRTANTTSALDDVWRRFNITFSAPKGQEFLTDVEITLASRGQDGKYIYVDLTSLTEKTFVCVDTRQSLLDTTAILNNGDINQLAGYDSLQNRLKVFSNVFDKKGYFANKPELQTWSLSKNATENITSKSATFIANNRELHIGLGGTKESTAPQWLGYINHTLFGKSYENELYQDEDTVHTYDEQSIGTLSKICLAGEYERVDAERRSGDLKVTFTHAGILNVGDNIIIREWMDADNSWEGAGVWVVTNTSTSTFFLCERLDTLDKHPSTNLFNGGGTQDNIGLISFRPYYYYGIKDGEAAIYRIWPDTRINDAASDIDNSYPKGKIEKSLPISTGVTSICTFYNKGTGGATPGTGASENGGGKIYALSSISNEIIVIDVMKKYNEWTTSKLTQNADIDLVFKSFKWSNDNINGDVNGTDEVFGGIAAESSPTINYAGVLSDILETKGTTADYIYDRDMDDNEGITTSQFDTRLWIQSRSTGDTGFSEGDRFLFCGRTQTSNTDGPDVLYCADRTPPTTVVTRTHYRFTTGGNKFNAGPGRRNDPRSYFYHYYDDDDNKHKLSRVSVYRDSKFTSNGTQGPLATPHYDKPYVNFGYNVGYELEEGMPSIIIGKYALFQIADNDGDGVLDGTGVVVPSTKSITDASETYKTGPYGRLHQRVCGHAVGLLGGVESGKWYRHWGRLHGRISVSGKDYFVGKHGDGPNEDAPEYMNINKCIFISTDTHYGDYQPKESYAWTGKTTVDTDISDAQTDLTISNSTYDLTTLEVGDTVNLKQTTNICATITLIDPSANKVRVNVTSSSIDSTGTLHPYSIHETFGLTNGAGGILNNEIAHHWSFDEDDKLNGNIFTTGEGSGHYTKTFMTPAAYWGGPKTSLYKNVNPGCVWKHEKLNFRGGIMMRPFQMDDEDFFNLIEGNGLFIDMPSWPNNVYHESQSSKIHYSENNASGYKNHFASKCFITAPIKGDTELRSNVYMCDLTFMFPDIASQEPIVEGDNRDTNYWNDGDSFEICCAGKVNAYITTDVDTKNVTRDATNHPVVQLGGNDFMGINSNLFESGSHYRHTTNSLVGLCITIKDSVTGSMETRYIVGSEKAGDSTTDDMFVAVHYPFGNAPAADDEFWIWKHSLACTAPIRLHKQTELRQGLGNALIGDPTLGEPVFAGTGSISISTDSNPICTTTGHHNLTTNDKIRFKNMSTASYNDGVHQVTVTGPDTFTSQNTTISQPSSTVTGTWELIENSESSAANPLTVSLTNPLISTHFGGLDMRKTKSYTISSVASTSSAEQKLTANANHLLVTGDTITYNAGGGDELDGTYNIDLVDPDELDITTTETATDTGTATTNQWEMLIAGTASKSQMGELRAGFAQWDKGDIAANIVRHDSTEDADRFSNFGESSLIITPTSLADQPGDVFLKNTRYYYKVSFIYDGYQEGPLSKSNWSFQDTSSRAKLSITLKVKEVSRRLTAVCLYRKNSINDFYKLVQQIPTDSGWSKDGDYYRYILGDEGELGATYEARTGMSEVLDTIKLNYGISAEIDGFLFAADCSHSEIKNASNMIFRSKPGMYSIFDYANDFLILKSKPTALANFNGRLYAFDDNNIYRINQQNLTIEDVYEGIGCSGKDSVIVTEYGMFFAHKTGAYMHNGQAPVKISQSIQKGGNTEEVFVGSDNIRDVSWEHVVTNSNSIPYVTYNSVMNCVLFNVEYIDSIKNNILGQSINQIAQSVARQYIWAYSLTSQRWDLWELAYNSKIGKPFTGKDGEVYWPIDNMIYENLGGGTARDYTWISKKITAGEDSITKVFNKVKINGLSKNINLGGSFVESSDKLIIKTSTGDIASADVTYSSDSASDSAYKIKGTNKKGRWLQFKVENVRDNIDSFGIILRRKGTK